MTREIFPFQLDRANLDKSAQIAQHPRLNNCGPHLRSSGNKVEQTSRSTAWGPIQRNFIFFPSAIDDAGLDGFYDLPRISRGCSLLCLHDWTRNLKLPAKQPSGVGDRFVLRAGD